MLKVVAIGLASDLGIAQQWHQIAERRTSTVLVQLDPGRLIQAFEKLTLQISHDRKSLRALEGKNIVLGEYRFTDRVLEGGTRERYVTVDLDAVSHLPEGDELKQYAIGGSIVGRLHKGDHHVCCPRLPDVWHRNMKTEIKWSIKSGSATTYYLVEAPIEKYSYPEHLYVHFFPNGRVRLVSSYPEPGNINHPVGNDLVLESSLAVQGKEMKSPAEIRYWKAQRFTEIH